MDIWSRTRRRYERYANIRFPELSGTRALLSVWRASTENSVQISQQRLNLSRIWWKNLTLKRVKWSIEADASFNSVKTGALIDEPILMAPYFKQPFVLQTDASQHGIAGILCQYDNNGLLHPVMYASRKLSSAESRYSSIERELLAIIWSLQHYSHIVFGQEITVQTDHQSLRYLDSLSEKNSRLTRWSLIL